MHFGTKFYGEVEERFTVSKNCEQNINCSFLKGLNNGLTLILSHLVLGIDSFLNYWIISLVVHFSIDTTCTDEFSFLIGQKVSNPFLTPAALPGLPATMQFTDSFNA